MAQGLFTLRQVNQAIRQGAWSAFNPPQWVEYLCVAGGGGGASEGGGGAGGLLTGMVPVTAGSSYTVTVGAGGAAATIGQDSVFGNIWKPIFKKWFEENTGLEVTQLTTDYI